MKHEYHKYWLADIQTNYFKFCLIMTELNIDQNENYAYSQCTPPLVYLIIQ